MPIPSSLTSSAIVNNKQTDKATQPYSLKTLQRWELFADVATTTWCATQPHITLPKVQVHAQLLTRYLQDMTAHQHHRLILSYLINLPSSRHSINHSADLTLMTDLPWFIWSDLIPKINSKNNTTDYLWQSTCLECFISGTTKNNASQTTDYIEINVASNGYHASYYFNDYRTPNTLPPQKLLSLPQLHNISSILSVEPLLQTTHMPITATASMPIQMLRQISIDLYSLAKIWQTLTHIHPTVILQDKHTQQLLYFAPKHANPPDFHLRELWSTIQIPLQRQIQI